MDNSDTKNEVCVVSTQKKPEWYFVYHSLTFYVMIFLNFIYYDYEIMCR